MFQPPMFRENRTEVMHDLIQAHPFSTLVSSVAGAPTVDHLPLVLHPELSNNGTIRGHIAKANPLWLNRTQISGVMAVFQGPHAYVSPSWYPSKKEHGKAVPTWNYAVVHARGKLAFHQDGDWLLQHLSELSGRHENHRAEPWKISDAPEEYIARMLKGIVGIELKIESLEGNRKVSQNKDEADRNGVKQGLLAEKSEAAEAMSGLIDGWG